MMEYVTLNNGIKMPKLGYGVYQTPPEDTCRCVREAIDVGYRAIDTAQAYYNEEGVGQALAESGLPREEFFLTTKVWITNAGYEKARASIEESLVKPAVNQIETHVFQQQKVAREYLRKYGCQAESWGPFAEGRKDMFTNPVLTAIGEKYGKTAAQTALRFLVQSDVVVIPKSVHQERMRQNFEIFDFRLTPEDMAAIEALDGGESLFFSHYDPKTVEWFMSIL